MDEPTMQKIVDIGEAIRHPLRLKILHLLSQREWYIYELARELNVSRQVLYLHLKRLEKAGFVEGDLRLEEDDMRAKNFYRLKDFNVALNLDDIRKIF
jgi:ArsR family transcriptional regulator